jgi:acyl-CoA synthetase (AMP-forming)/AMP-acid ligase II
LSDSFAPVSDEGVWLLGAIVPSAKVLFIQDGQHWTYEQFTVEIDRLAAAFVMKGIRPGDRIALHLRNGPEIAIAFFACFRVGAIAAPLNLRFKSAELEDALRRIKPSLYIGNFDLYDLIADVDTTLLATDARYVLGLVEHRGARLWSSLLADPAPPAPERIDTNAPAIVLLTSGTTGLPKLVAHSLASLSAATDRLLHLGADQDGVCVLLRPMVHASGLFYLLSAIRRRMTVVLLDTTDAERILDVAELYRCTFLPVPLLSCQAMTERQREHPRDLSSLKTCVISADVCPPGRQESFEAAFGLPLKSFWASTEGTFPFTHGLRSGALGRIHPPTEVRLVDDDGVGVPVGEIGEAMICGPHVMIGYWIDPGELAGLNDGWYRSGDMMRRDEDGNFWFVSRLKDLIVRAGSNISPLEVEHVLAQHPDVRDAAVIGIPDSTLGQRVIGFIQLRAGADGDSLARVMDTARVRLADYKLPERLILVEEVPRNALGKTDRKALAATAQDAM